MLFHFKYFRFLLIILDMYLFKEQTGIPRAIFSFSKTALEWANLNQNGPSKHLLHKKQGCLKWFVLLVCTGSLELIQ